MTAAPDVFEQAAAWRAAGKKVALATVVETWGASLRPAGSRLVVEEGGAFVGSVSGGCIEGAVVAEASRVMADGRPQLLTFGVSDEMAWDVGLPCGGRVSVLVEAIDGSAEILEQIVRAQKDKQSLVLVTTIPTGEARILRPGDPAFAGEAPEVARAARTAMDTDQCVTVVQEAGATLFFQPFNPPLRLVLVGAVHVAQALAPMAAIAGFEVILVDPRTAFATEARFPGIARSLRWPDRALAEIGLDQRTAVVTLSHDPKIDDPAVEAALRSPAFYVGCLGSAKTHASRVARLRERGFTEGEVGRIFGPVGVRIGGRSPGEIAVSILAQLVEQLRRGRPSREPLSGGSQGG